MSGHSKWANIKHKKGKTDALKAKLATKIGREITVAARMGGADPTGNMRLKLALQKARENNIPKDNIQRAIDKGVGATDMNAYEEIVYEGYGPAGVAVTVEVMTDNRNRAAADVRHAFSKQGGNLGESGCVGWMFKSKGVFVIDKEGHDEDEVTMLALEAGAEDLKSEDDVFEIYTTPEDYDAVYTGDLGEVGKKILLHLLRENGYDLSKVHGDCGIEIYENETQDTHSGGSGCACSAVVLASMIIPKLIDGTWKKVLFVPTGALMSKTSFNEGENVAGIAHAIFLEGVR